MDRGERDTRLNSHSKEGSPRITVGHVRHVEGGSAVRDDAPPVPLDHVRKAFVGSEALPFQAVLPPIEEGTSLERIGVVPELAEGLFEYVGPRPNAKQLPLS